MCMLELSSLNSFSPAPSDIYISFLSYAFMVRSHTVRGAGGFELLND